jgi:hypothetical protein
MYKELFFKAKTKGRHYLAIKIEFDSHRLGIPIYVHDMRYLTVVNIMGLVISIRSEYNSK